MKNVFVIGLDEHNHRLLKRLPEAEEVTFHQLLRPEQVLERETYPVGELLDEARARLDAFEGSVDGICGYIDFPVSNMIPVLAAERGLPGTSIDSVLKCEHKYWSRVVQREVAPEAVPGFARFDPFDDDALDKIDLRFPFWVKPIKSFSSFLGFHIRNTRDFQRAVAIIRQHIDRLSAPFFNTMLKMVDTPDDISDSGAGLCMAEQIIAGRQVTLEGYVRGGEVDVYGVVDSIRHPNRTTFARYQYPSRLPKGVQERMIDIAGRVLNHIDYDGAPFNAELYWSERYDKIWLLEFNTRISQSHCPLFEMVDGQSHHAVMTRLALGRDPRFPHRQGDFKMAGKLFLRKYGDAHVDAVPGEEDLARIREEMPEAIVHVLPKAGQKLSEMMDQDSYTYTLALLWLGAKDQKDLLAKYRRCIELLPFRFSSDQHTGLAQPIR